MINSKQAKELWRDFLSADRNTQLLVATIALTAVFVVTSGVLGLYDRLSSPSLTETQLFLKRWPFYTAGIVLTILPRIYLLVRMHF